MLKKGRLRATFFISNCLILSEKRQKNDLFVKKQAKKPFY